MGKGGARRVRDQLISFLKPHLLPPLAGQSIPAVSAYRRLLAAAQIAPGSAKALAVWNCHLRDHPAHVSENRSACRTAEIEGQDCPANGLPAAENACHVDAAHQSAEPVTNAA